MSLTTQQRKQLQDARDLIDALLNERGCSACLHLDGRTGKCDFWDAVVPVEARVAGCDMFEPEIPF